MLMPEVFRVRGNSPPGKVGDSIVRAVEKKGRVETISIGAGALNQAVKAIIRARGFAPELDLCFRPHFDELNTDEGLERTAIRLSITPAAPHRPESA